MAELARFARHPVLPKWIFGVLDSVLISKEKGRKIEHFNI